MRAHPRSRGENAKQSSATPGQYGSSPLTRGKRRPHRRGARYRRLIPAHAGKTCPFGVMEAFAGAHPRSRGENGTIFYATKACEGSSPLTRGKLGRRYLRAALLRLIPAHAGKTGDVRKRPHGSEAHPRSRGENHDDAGGRAPQWGSSPLTRGKQKWWGTCCLLVGLIPAHAGKTMMTVDHGCPCAAHPRSRGENAANSGTACIGRGSSPLTRGKRAIHVIAGPTMRLIPAHAGKTTGQRCTRRWPPAHPRSRGEN